MKDFDSAQPESKSVRQTIWFKVSQPLRKIWNVCKKSRFKSVNNRFDLESVAGKPHKNAQQAHKKQHKTLPF